MLLALNLPSCASSHSLDSIPNRVFTSTHMASGGTDFPAQSAANPLPHLNHHDEMSSFSESSSYTMSSPTGSATASSTTAMEESPESSPSRQRQPPSYLPEQIFSSPPDHHLYPESTLAAVESTRARFFARTEPSTSSNTSSRGFRSARPMRFDSRRPDGTRRAITSHPLSASSSSTISANSSSYRRSFFERCQKAMDQTRSSVRSARINEFRKGTDGYTAGMFSDELMDDLDEDADERSSRYSSPPYMDQQGRREEDDELTRRKIIAEYSRLKRIYELKGHLEIGWLDPEHVAWLEEEIRGQQQGTSSLQSTDMQPPLSDDFLLFANDQDLEQLWIDSQTQQPEPSFSIDHEGDSNMEASNNVDDDDGFVSDESFEQALASLPY